MNAEQYSDITVLYWPNITGTYSKLLLVACSESGETCKELLTTQAAPYHYVWRDRPGNYDFFIAIYQNDVEVKRKKFIETDKTGIHTVTSANIIFV